MPERRAAVSAVADGAWDDLLNPVAITSDAAGRIYVGDRGDRTVKAFGPGGVPAEQYGSFGPGPGELQDIDGVAAFAGQVLVSDPQSLRFVRFDADGTFLEDVPNDANAAALGTVGRDGIVIAGSPLWAMDAALDGRGALFEVMGPSGAVRLSGGDRRAADNPFVGHIRNFVLPAGSRDGTFVWLAQLNHPSVIRQPLMGGEPANVDRSLPFEWRELPGDFEPSNAFLGQGRNAPPPFDAISLSIATDASDRAFVLTALGPNPSGAEHASPVGVDVLHPDSGWTHRIRVPEPGTALTVSPDGSRLYILDEATAQIHVYQWSDDE